MNVLIILQGPAYGDERAYNGTNTSASRWTAHVEANNAWFDRPWGVSAMAR